MTLNRLISFCLALALFCAGHAQALTFRLSSNDVVGEPMTMRTQYEDTFVALGKVYGLGFRELVQANPDVLPWVPGEGTEIILPLSFILPRGGERESIVLNLAEFRMYHFLPEKNTVRSYAVGIGRQGWQTPTVETRVTSVAADPSWTPPESIRREHAAMGDILPRVVPPGPDNPLGKYAVRLSEPGYLFHGTNKQLGVGMRVSHGCVRLYDGDIEELAHSVSRGTPVKIIDEPVKAGWLEDRLYLEVHPPLEEQGEQEVNVKKIIGEAMLRKPETIIDIDWERVDELMTARNGIPADITRDSTVAESHRE